MAMDIIEGIKGKNQNECYTLLLELEQISESSNELYGYFDEFIKLTQSSSPLVRTRGFRLACTQARWDNENKLDRDIDVLLDMLRNEKGTQVRQCITALSGVVKYKQGLKDKIIQSLEDLEKQGFKESMRELIRKDMDKLKDLI